MRSSVRLDQTCDLDNREEHDLRCTGSRCARTREPGLLKTAEFADRFDPVGSSGGTSCPRVLITVFLRWSSISANYTRFAST